jgi:hypothetical protein
MKEFRNILLILRMAEVRQPIYALPLARKIKCSDVPQLAALSLASTRVLILLRTRQALMCISNWYPGRMEDVAIFLPTNNIERNGICQQKCAIL